MDQHLGASITLSFALVVVFAIILYEPEPVPRPPRVREVPEVSTPEPRPTPSPTAPLPAVTPVEPPAAQPADPDPEPAAPATPTALRHHEMAAAPIALPRREPERLMRTSAGRARAEAGSGPANATLPRPQVGRVPAHDAFTLANTGETLRDVAERVYGSAEEVDALWRLNRDLVGGRDAPLAAGTLLRTP